MTRRNAFRGLVLCVIWLQSNKLLRILFLREKHFTLTLSRIVNVSAFICKTPLESFERHNARCSHLLFQNIPNIVFSSEHSVLSANVSIIKITLPVSGRLQIWQYMVSDPIRLGAMMNIYNMHCIYMHIYALHICWHIDLYLLRTTNGDLITKCSPNRGLFTNTTKSKDIDD